MISSITIEGYRGFKHFEMEGLGSINLLVGTNNSGKTSVLEALYLLTAQGDPLALWNILWRRGERMASTGKAQRPELDVGHLFHGHEKHIGSRVLLSANNQKPGRSVSFEINELTVSNQAPLFQDGDVSDLALIVRGDAPTPYPIVRLTPAGGLLLSEVSLASRRHSLNRSLESTAVQFITAESLDSSDLVALWDKVTLTPDENLVLSALQYLDPDIERIASQSPAEYRGTRGAFIVKLRGRELPVPIGSMGDGMWRMLALALAISQCKGGVLLVDEIDTGLHYTVMSDMWRLIFGAAKELDVQVFATTHSQDCIRSLANVCLSDREANDAVSLQRIEMGKSHAIPYSENEIVVASDREIEVR